jgi:hypothetical protein
MSAFLSIADVSSYGQSASVKNIQIIDGGVNATFSIFQATDDEFAIIFPDGREMEIAVELVERIGEEAADRVLTAIWDRPVLKRDALGIHGTLFYDAGERREFLPTSMREVDWDERFVNEAQRRLFRHRR